MENKYNENNYNETNYNENNSENSYNENNNETNHNENNYSENNNQNINTEPTSEERREQETHTYSYSYLNQERNPNNIWRAEENTASNSGYHTESDNTNGRSQNQYSNQSHDYSQAEQNYNSQYGYHTGNYGSENNYGSNSSYGTGNNSSNSSYGTGNHTSNNSYSTGNYTSDNSYSTGNNSYSTGSNGSNNGYSTGNNGSNNNYSSGSYGYGGNRYSQNYSNNYNKEAAKQARKERRQRRGSFGIKVLKAACIALVCGVIGGGSFAGVNYVVSELTGTKDAIVAVPEAVSESASEQASIPTVGTVNNVVVSDVSQIAEDVMPSIVAITNMTETQIQTWFGQVRNYQDESAGSGIIVDQDDDYLYIATNNHVVEGATTLTVQFNDGAMVTANIKGSSPSNDLAVVEVALEDIEEETLEAIKVATLDKDEVKVGEPAIAIGNALGYGQSVTVGYISALEREVTTQDEFGQVISNNLLQTDAAINPGNSGGALLNMNGEVIGINSAKYSDTTVEGMGFAIPISSATPIIEELIDRELVDEEEKPYLGISGVDVADEDAKTYNMPSGIFVAKVYKDSAAEKAGLKQGDIITSFDGKKVDSMRELQEILQYHPAGETVSVTYMRTQDGEYQEHEVSVTLGYKSDAKIEE